MKLPKLIFYTHSDNIINIELIFPFLILFFNDNDITSVKNFQVILYCIRNFLAGKAKCILTRKRKFPKYANKDVCESIRLSWQLFSLQWLNFKIDYWRKLIQFYKLNFILIFFIHIIKSLIFDSFLFYVLFANQ